MSRAGTLLEVIVPEDRLAPTPTSEAAKGRGKRPAEISSEDHAQGVILVLTFTHHHRIRRCAGITNEDHAQGVPLALTYTHHLPHQHHRTRSCAEIISVMEEIALGAHLALMYINFLVTCAEILLSRENVQEGTPARSIILDAERLLLILPMQHQKEPLRNFVETIFEENARVGHPVRLCTRTTSCLYVETLLRVSAIVGFHAHTTTCPTSRPQGRRRAEISRSRHAREGVLALFYTYLNTWKYAAILLGGNADAVLSARSTTITTYSNHNHNHLPRF